MNWFIIKNSKISFIRAIAKISISIYCWMVLLEIFTIAATRLVTKEFFVFLRVLYTLERNCDRHMKTTAITSIGVYLNEVLYSGNLFMFRTSAESGITSAIRNDAAIQSIDSYAA